MAELLPLPPGYRWELGGHYVMQQEAFRSLTLVMAVAVMLVFIMLAFQFRSVLLPLLIFLTQPLSLVSGLFALWLTDTPLNVSSYMGAILLIGLDMKNGILLVEYIQQLLAKGWSFGRRWSSAGRHAIRLILMTSLAAILGLLPLALGIGPARNAAAACYHGDWRVDCQHAIHPHGDSGWLFSSGKRLNDVVASSNTGLVVILLLAGAVGRLVFLSIGNATEKQAEETPLSPVVVVPATAVYFGEWTELLGTTQPLPNLLARISAPVEGRVLSILGDGKGKTFAEGDRVEKDQIIALLDDSVVRAYRDKLAAMLVELEKQKQNGVTGQCGGGMASGRPGRS